MAGTIMRCTEKDFILHESDLLQIMGHHITALILKGSYDEEVAKAYDLAGKDLGFNLTLFHIDHYYSGYWQFKFGLKEYLKTPATDYMIFPTDVALAELMKKVSVNADVEFAIISTDYFGGMGQQFASVYKNATLASESITTISKALEYLGVKREKGLDEFDTVGLGNIRSQPEILDKYYDLCEKHNL
jgi:hypothetical protein